MKRLFASMCLELAALTALLVLPPRWTAARVALAQDTAFSAANQDAWIITSLQVTTADGATTDAVAQLLAAQLAPGETVDLGRGMSFTELPGIPASGLDRDGNTVPNVRVRAGIFAAGGERLPGVVLSPPQSPDGSPEAAVSEFAGFDLSALGISGPIGGGTISYSLVQTLPPLDPGSEAGLSDLDALGYRWRQGRYQVLGAPGPAGQHVPGLVVDAQVGGVAPIGAAGSPTAAPVTWAAVGDATPIGAQLQPGAGVAALWAAGKGVVTAQQAAAERRTARRLCSPVCIFKVQASGAYFEQADIDPMGAHISLDASGCIGRDTHWVFSASCDAGAVVNPNVGTLHEIYEGVHGSIASSEGCDFNSMLSFDVDPLKTAPNTHPMGTINVHGLSYQGPLMIDGLLDQRWLEGVKIHSNTTGQVGCSTEQDHGGGAIIGVPAVLQFECGPGEDIDSGQIDFAPWAPGAGRVSDGPQAATGEFPVNLMCTAGFVPSNVTKSTSLLGAIVAVLKGPPGTRNQLDGSLRLIISLYPN